MEVYELLKIIKKRLLLIISIFILIVSGTAVTNLLILPEIFEAQTQILVNQKQQVIVPGYFENDIQLIETYNEIIKSPAILDIVIAKLNLKTTTEELSEQVTVLNNERSKVVTIILEDPSPKQAVTLVNTITETFKEETPSLMNLDNVNILASAKFSEAMKPVKPKKALNIGISAVISIFLGIGFALLLEYFDSRVRNERDIEKVINAPIIGYVSPFSTGIRKKPRGGRKKVAKEKRSRSVTKKT
ncbi:YveK family protein [Ureibacillus manganicus]|uniref:YveK family protein n=1 Tax=Ureibacillus manganicus TaxID=1266064 RepID=UPI00068D2FCC|nr:Wzz/FepE/Etk N-terminal domain-containing protein [Ureibacillus manganicus]